MRTIKFRIWNEKLNAFVYFNLNDKEAVSCCMDTRALKQQYTGLRDKNGKEIYEADLIKHPKYPTPLRVEWDYDQWGLFDGICNEASIDEKCEIIGNIYKND